MLGRGSRAFTPRMINRCFGAAILGVWTSRCIVSLLECSKKHSDWTAYRLYRRCCRSLVNKRYSTIRSVPSWSSGGHFRSSFSWDRSIIPDGDLDGLFKIEIKLVGPSYSDIVWVETLVKLHFEETWIFSLHRILWIEERVISALLNGSFVENSLLYLLVQTALEKVEWLPREVKITETTVSLPKSEFSFWSFSVIRA